MWFNPIRKWLFRSPLRGYATKYITVIRYEGGKSGNRYEVPVNYVRDGDDLLVTSYRSQTWWQNLQGGMPVMVWLMGKWIQANAEAYSDQTDVARYLQEYLEIAPQQAKFFSVSVDWAGHPFPEDVLRAAQRMVVVRLTLNQEDSRRSTNSA